MSNTETAVATAPKNGLAEKEVVFLAFGSNEEVKLSIPIIRKFLAKPTRSGAEASDADCVKFMMLCRARALNPFEGDAFLVGYDGRNGPEFSLITAHQAFLKRAESAEDFNGIESGVIVANKNGEIIERTGDFFLDGETVLGGWCNVHRTGVSIPFKSRLRLQSRRKQTAIWDADASGMICKCAEADALRMAFPTKLGGMVLEDRREEIDVTPPKATESKLFKDTPALPAPVAPVEVVKPALKERAKAEPKAPAAAEPPPVASPAPVQETLIDVPAKSLPDQVRELIKSTGVQWREACGILLRNEVVSQDYATPDDATDEELKEALHFWPSIVKLAKKGGDK